MIRSYFYLGLCLLLLSPLGCNSSSTPTPNSGGASGNSMGVIPGMSMTGNGVSPNQTMTNSNPSGSNMNTAVGNPPPSTGGSASANPSNMSNGTPMGGQPTSTNTPMTPMNMGGGASSQGSMGGMVSPPPVDDDCSRLCRYLEMCNQCFFDGQGQCLDQDGCAQVCRADTAPVVAQCVGALPACDDDAFQGCYDANAGNDSCAETCRKLQDCGECFLDENGEDCLPIAACAVVCREQTPSDTAACIAALDDCEGIQACYDNPNP